MADPLRAGAVSGRAGAVSRAGLRDLGAVLAQGRGAHLPVRRKLCATEYLRGHILTGFPWNLPAYGWAASLGVLQSASVVGAYGLSLLTILLGAVAGAASRIANAARRFCLPR